MRFMVRPREMVLVAFLLLIGGLLLLPTRGEPLSAALATNSYLPIAQRQPSPTPTATATPSPGWYVEYFGNTSLSGVPFRAVWEEYDAPEKSWGESAPFPGMPIDNFSVRFTADKQFQAGNYAFFVSVDDGGRLYVDGNLVVDAWHGSLRGTATYRWDGFLTAGLHRIRLEFYDAEKGARVRCLWINQDLYPDWRAEYWDNNAMSGPPRIVRNEAEIKYDWGTGSPDPSLPSDNFSVRWTKAVWFNTGKYVFYTTAEGGGVRLWIDKWVPDHDEIIDDWGIWPNRTRSEDEYLEEDGWYLLTVAYRAGEGKAYCNFRYLYGGASSTWVGEYYKDENLQSFYKVRNDGGIDFDWGSDAPMSGMSKDHFSVRWTHTVKLEADAYRFSATYDDGCRLWVDGSMVINDWNTGGLRTNHGDIVLHSGWHVIRMEYFENISRAAAKLTWDIYDDIQFYRADYWREIRMGGEERGDYTEYLANVAIDVGQGSPAPGIQPDDWSARFKEHRYFGSSGSYRFTVEYDGGMVLYVDGKERVNDWNNTGRKTASSTVYLDKGHHWIKLHYADRGIGSNGYVTLTITKQ